MSRPHPETISPTAHYTGYVWFAHGQSHEAFATRTGRLMYQALRGPKRTLADYVIAVRRVGDRQVLEVTASSAALCATGFG